jgi:hypothetical protein
MEKTKISINDVSVTVPYNGTDINNIMVATQLAVELAGWHRDTIEDWIIQKAEDLKNEQ